MTSIPLRPTLDAIRLSRGIVLALALLPLALLALAIRLPRPAGAPLAGPQVSPLYRTVADLPLPLQYAVSRDLGRDDPSYHLTSSGDDIRVTNAAQGLSATLGANRLRVTAGGQTWSL